MKDLSDRNAEKIKWNEILRNHLVILQFLNKYSYNVKEVFIEPLKENLPPGSEALRQEVLM